METLQADFKKSHFMTTDGDTGMTTQFGLSKGKYARTIVAEMGRAKGRRTVQSADFILGLAEEALPIDRVRFNKRLISVCNDEENDFATTENQNLFSIFVIIS
ncbi:hypothetical protein BKA67DRAFT_537258 [Truncatella angustata]|uniref:Uncharacterized protein n=1 Tax=Truncatella angustata TaxID=152316 RepID=A0A9P8ZX16_9PEZI|nr:uncharacterized protein BKA67DRAFT_537258 [Truncatella angustata]KAH6653626.1 hypothetical protein BKA67DRAFT_537258 [Truncatella angustata]